MTKKTPVTVPQILSQEELEASSLELESRSLEAQANEELPITLIVSLKKIAYYTAKVGLPLNEACLLVNIDEKKFREQMKTHPIIEKIIKIKELEYKKDLMYTISQKAKSGDDKLAQWLLEKRYPDEFGSKKGGPDPDDGIFIQAIDFIRKNGDNQPLVSEGSARTIVVKSSNSENKEGFLDKIGKILNG